MEDLTPDTSGIIVHLKVGPNPDNEKVWEEIMNGKIYIWRTPEELEAQIKRDKENGR